MRTATRTATGKSLIRAAIVVVVVLFAPSSPAEPERKGLRLLSNHMVQKGPAFKMQMESTIDAVSGQVKVRYTDEDSKEKVIEERLELPADLANGLILALLKNISPKAPKTTVSMLAITPEPRLVELELTPAGEEPFSTAGSGRKAMHYVVKVHMPGLTSSV